MALIVGVHPGDSVYFGDEPAKVLSFEGHSRAVLLFRGKQITVVDDKATEISKGVYVSCGMPKVAREGGVALPRLVIDAPRSLVILREDLYHGRQHRKQFQRQGVPDPA